jgi:hypothetical protein
MLRAAVLLGSGALALAGAFLLARGLTGPGVYALASGVLIALGTAFERWRYRANERRARASWEPTGECFEDPQTGKTVRVFYDGSSGERHYVSDSEAAPAAGTHSDS